MSVSLNIDLGQIIIATLIAILGYLIKREITTFGDRLDRHENNISHMMTDMATVVAQIGFINKLIGVDNAIIELRRVIKDGK